jgi:hypothetical protein
MFGLGQEADRARLGLGGPALAFTGSALMSVPIPWSVKISRSRAWGRRPSMM